MIITSLSICIWKIVHFYNRIIHTTTYRLQAMAYNAKVLSSQEKAMDEYLRRQRANAEQHIHQMYQSPYSAAEAARHRAAAAGTSKEIGSASGGFVRLQVLLDAICLRRTKSDKSKSGEPLVKLPIKNVLLPV